VDAVSL